jgi:nitrogen fixation protein FixH
MRARIQLIAGAGILCAMLCAACSKDEAAGPVTAGTTTGAGMAIAFRSQTDPPVAGKNTFEVTVTKDGAPVADASVRARFTMPAMPSMNMPEMHSEATLEPVGGGRYRGTGELSMAGTWNVRVIVSKGAEQLGTQTLSIVAK